MKQQIRAWHDKASAALPYKSYLGQMTDIVAHKLKINVGIRDYYRFEFYKANSPWRERERYVALGGSTYFPFAGNPLKFTTTLSNKYIQKTLLAGFGLPTPKLLAVAGLHRGIETRDQLERLLATIDSELVFKPLSGAGGTHVNVVSRDGLKLFLAGTPVTSADLWQLVENDYERGVLIEERAYNHKAVAELCPTCLNTFRVITIATMDGKIHAPAISLKVGRKGSMADNNGANNLQLNLRDDGTVYNVYDFNARKDTDRHPDTGFSFDGYRAPGVPEVRALAIQAAQRFNFLKAIGWDIALTPEGPTIIEGNIGFGCSSLQRGRPGIITDELAEGLPRYTWRTRWDKSCLYPGYSRKHSRSQR